MIPALLLGRKGSVGFPSKNIYPVLGRPLMVYPLLAALNAKMVDEVYVSTDSPEIKKIAKKYGVRIIDRPSYLCTKEALSEDAYIHGYNYIKEITGKKVKLLVLLFCNAPTILSETIDEGIKILKKRPETDSAVTVSPYNMYTPIRARRVGEDGLLHPFIPFDVYEELGISVNSDRNSQGDVLFADVSVSIVRPRCLENINEGLLPQKWMGRKIYPLQQWGGCDVDFEWQIPQIEYWLKKHGFSENEIPYDKIEI